MELVFAFLAVTNALDVGLAPTLLSHGFVLFCNMMSQCLPLFGKSFDHSSAMASLTMLRVESGFLKTWWNAESLESPLLDSFKLVPTFQFSPLKWLFESAHFQSKRF